MFPNKASFYSELSTPRPTPKLEDHPFLSAARDWVFNIFVATLHTNAGQLSRYNDGLRAGRSGDRIPVEARFSALVQTCPEAYPASYTKGTWSFQGVKRPERGVDHPHHLAPKLKKEQSYNSTPLWAFVDCSSVNFTFTFTFIV